MKGRCHLLTRRMMGMDPFGSIRDSVDRAIEGFFDGGSQGLQGLALGSRGLGALDLWEDEDTLFVEVDVPGLELNQIEVSVEDDTLTVSGKRIVRELENVVRYCNERGTSEFRRVIQLPTETDVDRVNAKLKNGVLTITLPRAEAVKPKRIEVKGIG